MSARQFQEYKDGEIQTAIMLGFGLGTIFRLKKATTEEEIMSEMKAARRRKYERL